jgi:hypothetical protein
MKITAKTIAILVLVTFTLSECKKDKNIVSLPPPITNSPELITSIELQLRDSANISTVIYAKYRDPDGPGGNSAVQFDSIKLQANKTYFVDVLIFDETKSPVDTVSKEIYNERDEHQFFFEHSNAVSSFYLDTDTKGIPVGLKSKWRTKNTGIGTSKITLKHQPDGTKNGVITTGETDLEVTFKNKIQ